MSAVKRRHFSSSSKNKIKRNCKKKKKIDDKIIVFLIRGKTEFLSESFFKHNDLLEHAAEFKTI